MAVTAELDLQISAFQDALRRAESQFDRFAHDVGESSGKQAGTNMAGGLATALSVGLAAAATVVAAAAAASGAAILGGMKRAMDAETLEMSFSVLIGDEAKTKATLDSLRKLGESTPFTFPELAQSGRMLIAFGEDAGQVTDTLRKIGDVASGVGAPIGDIAEIYGKARVAGTLFAEDLNQLMGRGIPIMGEFAKQLGVSEGQVKKMASEGKVTFPMLEQAFKDLTGEGGKFGGMMEAQSKTIAGLMSTLQDTWDGVLLALGEPINDALRPLLADSIEMVEGLKDVAAGIGKVIADSLKVAIAAWKEFSMADMGTILAASLSMAFKEAGNVLWATLWGTVRAAGQYLFEYFKTAASVFEILTTADFWKGMGNALMSLALEFSAMLQDALGSILAEMKKIPGLGRLVGDGDTDAKAGAAVLRDMAGAHANAAGGQLAPALDVIANRLAEAGSNIVNAFKDGYSGSADIFDTSGEASVLNAALERLAGAVTAMDEATKKADSAGKGQASANGTAPGAPGAGVSLNGSLSGAVNTIMGRSTHALLQEKTNSLLEKIDKSTSEMAKNSAPKPTAPQPSKTVNEAKFT